MFLKKLRTGIFYRNRHRRGDSSPCAGEGTVQGSEGCVCGNNLIVPVVWVGRKARFSRAKFNKLTSLSSQEDIQISKSNHLFYLYSKRPKSFKSLQIFCVKIHKNQITLIFIQLSLHIIAQKNHKIKFFNKNLHINYSKIIW